MKSPKRPTWIQYINTYYDIYVFDLNGKNSQAAADKAALTGCLTACLALASASATAEVRVYDPNVGQSHISIPRETIETAPEKLENVVNEGSKMVVQLGVATPNVSDSAYVAALQMIQPKAPKLGSVRVFIKADDLNETMVDQLKEIKALDGLNSEFYFQDVKPADLVKLFRDKVKDYPKDMVFNVDFNSALATELQVKGKNVIVYTDPKGKISQFELNSMYSFKTAIERIKQGVAN